MNETSKRTTAWLLVFMILLLLMLAGCATQTPPDVGQVIVAPKVHLPPLPKLVQETPPMPVGFYQQTLADYFSPSPPAPTALTPLTPVAGPGPGKPAPPGRGRPGRVPRPGRCGPPANAAAV